MTLTVPLKNLAFVFPGQGSQKVGMLAEVAERLDIVAQTFDEASSVLGYDLWKLVQEGPQDALNLTERTQPALLTSSVALWRAWCQSGGARPSLMAGHSLGEFSALVCAGSLDFQDAVRLVRQRGAYMQSAVPVGVGAMAAVMGLDDDNIAAACKEAAQGEVVEAVNYNSPGQVVIAGHSEAVKRAAEACRARGAKRAVPLPVSAPFHTSLMRPAGERLANDVAGLLLREPEIPVLQNVHAASETDPQRIAALLVEQIHSPVQWVKTVHNLVNSGVSTVIECGPGKVLSGLCKRIERGLDCLALETPADFDSALAVLNA